MPSLSRQSNEEQFKDVYFGKVDVDVLDKVAARYGIVAMPTFYLFKNGEKAAEMKGANPSALSEMLAKAL
jgi:thioredoxin 1